MRTSLFRLLSFSCYGKPGLALCCVTAALLIPLTSEAASATWSNNPSSDDWNTAANWVPNTVPNSSSDIASFGASDVTALSINTTVELDSVVFNPGASPFTITSGGGTNLSFTGSGIVNSSGVVQSLVKVPNGLVIFYNNASAGEMTSLSGVFFVFYDESSRDLLLLILRAVESIRPNCLSGIRLPQRMLRLRPMKAQS